MPDRDKPVPFGSRRGTHGKCGLTVGIAMILIVALPHAISGQIKPVGPTDNSPQEPKAKAEPEKPVRPSALKLPDGTVVLVVRAGNDPDPAVDRVLLSPHEYKALLERLEEAKKSRELGGKPSPPSGCALRGKIEMRGDRLVAAVTATFTFRTTTPRSLVALGCQRASVVAARSLQGTGPAPLPILGVAAEEGLTVLADVVGEQSVVLDLEVPVTARGNKNEVGFDLGLPHAAVTTLSLVQPPARIKTLAVGTRTDLSSPAAKPTDIKRINVPVDQITGKAYPLGTTDILELTWDAPTATTPSAEAILLADTDVTVRLDETQVETEAKIRLRGSAREWPLTLPPGADVSIDRVDSGASAGPEPMSAGSAATVVRPTDPNKPVWTIRLPNELVPSEWQVNVSIRQSRPKPNDPKYRGPYAVGPFSLSPAVRQSARVRVFATPGVRVGYRPLPEFRRLDLPAGADEDLVASFSTTAVLPAPTGSKPPAWIELDARAASSVLRVRPSHRWKLTPAGWRLESLIRVTPPPRGEVKQLSVEVPIGWQLVEAGPEELVDELRDEKVTASTRTLLIRLTNPARGPVDISLTATVPQTPGARETSLPQPRFLQADERETKLQVSVPDGFEVRGATAPWDATTAVSPDPLRAVSASASAGTPVTMIGGEFDRGFGRLDLSWQIYRPELNCEIRAEATVQDRQVVISQTLKFRSVAESLKPIRLRGPKLVGLQSNPPLEPVGPDEWEFRPPADAKEFKFTVGYAVRMARKSEVGAVAVPIDLMWPETATRVETVLRIWGGGARRADRFEGPWRELPMEPAADRESLPWYVLTAVGIGPTLRLEIPEATTIPVVPVERTLVQAAITEDGSCGVRARYFLRKSNASPVELEVPPGNSLELFLDGRKVEPQIVSAHGDGSARVVRITTSESRPGRQFVVLEVRQQSTTQRDRGKRTIAVPILPAGQFRSPARWQLTSPAGLTPLFFTDDWQLDLRWVWRGYCFAPAASVTTDELERWFMGGTEEESSDPDMWSTSGGESFAARQSSGGTLQVMMLPRLVWMGVCSALVFVFGYLLTRARPGVIGPILAVSGVSVTIAAIRIPHPAAELAAGAQPGFFFVALLIGGKILWHWYSRRLMERLPGFSRVNPYRSSTQPASPQNSLPVGATPPGTGSRQNRGPSDVLVLDPNGSTAPPVADHAHGSGR